MAITVVACPRCRQPLRLREGESTVQCTGCGSTATRTSALAAPPGGASGRSEGSARQTILVASLLTLAAGLTGLALSRRSPRPTVPPPSPSGSPVIYAAPSAAPVAPTPEGELAWDALARAPVVTAIDDDGVEDFVGFFRVWDGRSAWIPYAGAFDGATLKMLWQTDSIDPRLLKQPGVVPLAVIAGQRVIVADTTSRLRAYRLTSGERDAVIKLAGPVAEVCPSPESPSRAWVNVVSGGDSMVDFMTGKVDLTPRPKWCPERAYQTAVVPPLPRHPTASELAANASKKAEVSACFDTFQNGVMAQATCRAARVPKSADGFVARYELANGPLTIAFGTQGGRPAVVCSTSGTSWSRAFAEDDANGKNSPPVVADVAFGRVYLVFERVYFDARLAALDAKTGALVWDAPLGGSLRANDGVGAGAAQSLLATAARVYVVRAGGGLNIFDAASGKPIGTLGRQ